MMPGLTTSPGKTSHVFLHTLTSKHLAFAFECTDLWRATLREGKPMNRMVQTRISLTNSTRPASMRLDTASGRCARSTASALSTTSRLMQGGCDPRPAAGMTVLTACNGSLQARGNPLEPLAISVTDVSIAGNLQLHYVHPILARKDKLHCCTDLGAGEFSGIADVKQ